MAAPTTAAHVKKALANPEPSTHGPKPEWRPLSRRVRSWGDSGRAGYRIRSGTVTQRELTKSRGVCGSRYRCAASLSITTVSR